MGCLELATGEANVCIVGVGLTVDQACPLQCWFQIFSYGDRDRGGGQESRDIICPTGLTQPTMSGVRGGGGASFQHAFLGLHTCGSVKARGYSKNSPTPLFFSP